MPTTLIGDTRVNYSDTPASSSARETLILLHGLGSTQNYWYPVIPELTQNGYRCIALDHSGHGRSSYTQIEQSTESLAKYVVGLMDYLNIEKAVVAGHSMSGIIAGNLAAAYPTRFVASILLGSPYPGPELLSVFEGRIEAVEKGGIEAMANSIPSGATHESASPLVRAFIRELIMSATPQRYISKCRVLASAKPPKFADVKMPVLIIAGDSDKAAPPSMSERILKELGTSEGEKRLVVLENCGHWMVVEKPEETASEILKFLKNIQ